MQRQNLLWKFRPDSWAPKNPKESQRFNWATDWRKARKWERTNVSLCRSEQRGWSRVHLSIWNVQSQPSVAHPFLLVSHSTSFSLVNLQNCQLRVVSKSKTSHKKPLWTIPKPTVWSVFGIQMSYMSWFWPKPSSSRMAMGLTGSFKNSMTCFLEPDG